MQSSGAQPGNFQAYRDGHLSYTIKLYHMRKFDMLKMSKNYADIGKTWA